MKTHHRLVITFVFIVVTATLVSCVSSRILLTGVSSHVANRNQAIERFGPPIYYGIPGRNDHVFLALYPKQGADFERFEIFRYRGLVQAPNAEYNGMAAEMTLGTSEIAGVPLALWDRLSTCRKNHFFCAEYGNRKSPFQFYETSSKLGEILQPKH